MTMTRCCTRKTPVMSRNPRLREGLRVTLMIFIAFEAVLEDETGCHHVTYALSVSM
jgi:hypothetical protein